MSRVVACAWGLVALARAVSFSVDTDSGAYFFEAAPVCAQWGVRAR